MEEKGELFYVTPQKERKQNDKTKPTAFHTLITEPLSE